jgi:uncharacterized protein (DUF58 family)
VSQIPPANQPVPETEPPRRRVAGIKSLVLTIAFVFLLIVAMLLDIPYLYIMAIALALLQPVSYTLASRFAPRYTAQRHLPATAVEGKPFPMELAVQVRGGLPQGAVALRDPLPVSMQLEPSLDPPVLRDPEAWDGNLGKWSSTLTAPVRGLHRFEDVRMEATDPLGLFFFESRIPCPGEIVVHPCPVPSRTPRAGGAGWRGLRDRDGSARRGEGLDFHGVRDYRPGDPSRRVHWRTTARRGTLAVVEFEKAFQQDVCLVIDHGVGFPEGEGRETPLEYAVKAAATRVDQVLSTGGGITLVTGSGAVRVRAGEPDVDVGRFRLMDVLARLQPESTCKPGRMVRSLLDRESAEIEVLTCRSDSDLEDALAHGVRQGHAVRVVWFDPASFGGEVARAPALSGVAVCRMSRSDSPWRDGGRRFLACLDGHGD